MNKVVVPELVYRRISERRPLAEIVDMLNIGWDVIMRGTEYTIGKLEITEDGECKQEIIYGDKNCSTKEKFINLYLKRYSVEEGVTMTGDVRWVGQPYARWELTIHLSHDGYPAVALATKLQNHLRDTTTFIRSDKAIVTFDATPKPTYNLTDSKSSVSR